MQHDQVEPAVDRIRHPVVGVKRGQTRLRHDHAIEGAMVRAWDRRRNSRKIIGIVLAVARRARLCGGQIANSAAVPGTCSAALRCKVDGLVGVTGRARRHNAPEASPRRWRRPSWCWRLALLLGGCFGERSRRLRPARGALEQIPLGASQEQVLIVLGTPSTVATVSGEAFYYISQRAERPVSFMQPRITDQRVIAVYFDKNRQVQRLAEYGMKDGKIFDFISRTTPTSGADLNNLLTERLPHRSRTRS